MTPSSRGVAIGRILTPDLIGERVERRDGAREPDTPEVAGQRRGGHLGVGHAGTLGGSHHRSVIPNTAAGAPQRPLERQ